MSNYKKLSHVIYRCTYHIVWTPKYRFRILEGLVKELLSKDIQILLEWKCCELIEMNIQIDHIHLIVSAPPKISISQLMGILKGKTAIKIFKSYPQLKKKPYWGNHFWARGYCVDTIGLDEDKIKKYVKYHNPNNILFEGGCDPGVTDPVSGEIFYNETAFDGGFDKLSLVIDHEQWHSRRVTTGAYESSGNSVSTEEYLNYLRNYKRQGFYRDHNMSIKSSINQHGTNAGIDPSMFMPYTGFQKAPFWHGIYRIKRLW